MRLTFPKTCCSVNKFSGKEHQALISACVSIFGEAIPEDDRGVVGTSVTIPGGPLWFPHETSLREQHATRIFRMSRATAVAHGPTLRDADRNADPSLIHDYGSHQGCLVAQTV